MEKYNAQKYDNPPEAYGAFAYAAMDRILNAIEINFGIGGARCLLRVNDDAFYALASPTIGANTSANASKPKLAPHRTRSRARARPSVGFEAVDFALVGLSIGCSIHQQHTKKKDQIEHRKH